jgi:uncharacterized membrane protein required for colicin V production
VRKEERKTMDVKLVILFVTMFGIVTGTILLMLALDGWVFAVADAAWVATCVLVEKKLLRV